MCFYGSYPIFGNYARNSTAFFVIWCCSLLSYAQLLLVKDRLRNFFRVPCDASEHATHVSIALPPGAAPQLPPDPLRIVRLARRLAARFAPAARKRWQTVPVRRTASGAAYVEFRCARYMLRHGSFQRAGPQLVGSPLSEISGTDGLTSSRQQALLEIVGPNQIPYSLEPLGAMLAA